MILYNWIQDGGLKGGYIPCCSMTKDSSRGNTVSLQNRPSCPLIPYSFSPVCLPQLPAFYQYITNLLHIDRSLTASCWPYVRYPFTCLLPTHHLPLACTLPSTWGLPTEHPLFACRPPQTACGMPTAWKSTVKVPTSLVACGCHHLGTPARDWESRAKGPTGLQQPSRGMVASVWGC